MTKSFENILAVLMFGICILCLLFVSESHYSKCLSTTGKETVDAMLAEISASGEITLVMYDLCAEALYAAGYEGECIITVYTYETAVDGTLHQYMTSWNEIKAGLIANNRYICPDGCYVKVSVRAYLEGEYSLRRMVNHHEDFTTCAYVKGGA